MNNKAIILIGAIGALTIILLRRVRWCAEQMAVQMCFNPRAYVRRDITPAKHASDDCVSIHAPT